MSSFCKPGKKYGGAWGEFAPEMTKVVQDNENRTPEITHKLWNLAAFEPQNCEKQPTKLKCYFFPVASEIHKDEVRN